MISQLGVGAESNRALCGAKFNNYFSMVRIEIYTDFLSDLTYVYVGMGYIWQSAIYFRQASLNFLSSVFIVKLAPYTAV